jgi:isocitrate dehydrogenase (NAD+)
VTATQKRPSIVRIAGDGVGPELVAAGSALLEDVLGAVDWVDVPAGLGAWHAHGATAPAETLAALREHGLAIKGPFATPNGGDIRSANFYIRRELDLFACLRPVPIDLARPILLVRENVEDLYGAEERLAAPGVAHATKVATEAGCRRIAEYAFGLARREQRTRVTVVHKANNLKLTEGMFLEVAQDVARAYPDVEIDEMIADTACATLVSDPARFDVVLTSNTFGDLLSSLGAAVAGSLGLVGSLNSGHGRHVAEAGHGDAGQLAGTGQVNPVAFLRSIALLLAAMGERTAATAVDRALDDVHRDGPKTLDLGGRASTVDVLGLVRERVAAVLQQEVNVS